MVKPQPYVTPVCPLDLALFPGGREGGCDLKCHSALPSALNLILAGHCRSGVAESYGGAHIYLRVIYVIIHVL